MLFDSIHFKVKPETRQIYLDMRGIQSARLLTASPGITEAFTWVDLSQPTLDSFLRTKSKIYSTFIPSNRFHP